MHALHLPYCKIAEIDESIGAANRDVPLFCTQMSNTPSRHRVHHECESDIFLPPNCTIRLHPLE
jgi:hypothetical protein